MRIVAPLLRFAADRWVAAGRTDPYPEWLAEVAELRAGVWYGGLQALWFAISLAASRPPAGDTPPRPLRPAALGPVMLLLLAPLAAGLTYASVGVLLDSANQHSIAVRLAGFGVATLAFAVAGQALGRRFPLCASTLPTYRLVVTAVVGAALIGLGAILDQLLLRELIRQLSPAPVPLIGSGGIVAAVTLWAVLLAVLVIAVRLRARRLVARLLAVLGGLLVADVAVTAAALPTMLRVRGAPSLLPLWFPVTVLGRGFGPHQIAEPLSQYLAALTGTLLPSTAFAVAYLVVSARPRPMPRYAAEQDGPIPGRTAAGWWFALLGGLGWVVGSAWLPLVSYRNWDADNNVELYFAQLDLRKLAILVCCCGLALALRGAGPAWPIGGAAAALCVLDVALYRAQLPAAVTAALAAAALLIPTAAVLGSRRLRRPGQRYGHTTLPVVAILAGCCSCAPAAFVVLASGSLPVVSTFPLAVALSCGTLSALSGYCVCRARAETGRPARWLWVPLVGVLPGGLAVLGAAIATTSSGALLLSLVVVWPVTTMLAIGLAPGRRRATRARRGGLAALALALVLAEPLVLYTSLALSTILDAPTGSGTDIGDAAPFHFPGFLAMGALLALGYCAAQKRPPAPLPDDPVAAVPQAR